MGAALGANTFTEEYVSGKVKEWVNEIMRLSVIATAQVMQSMPLLLTVSPVTGYTAQGPYLAVKGSSVWLTVSPVTEHGLFLHKGDTLVCVRYGWNLSNTPLSCSCGTSFSVDHVMTCHMGAIPTIRHNEIRDIMATLLTEICHNVATEPLLQPLTNESFTHRSSNTDPSAHLNMHARGIEVFGAQAKTHFSMLGSSTQTCQATAP